MQGKGNKTTGCDLQAQKSKQGVRARGTVAEELERRKQNTELGKLCTTLGTQDMASC